MGSVRLSWYCTLALGANSNLYFCEDTQHSHEGLREGSGVIGDPQWGGPGSDTHLQDHGHQRLCLQICHVLSQAGSLPRIECNELELAGPWVLNEPLRREFLRVWP